MFALGLLLSPSKIIVSLLTARAAFEFDHFRGKAYGVESHPVFRSKGAEWDLIPLTSAYVEHGTLKFIIVERRHTLDPVDLAGIRDVQGCG